MFCTNCGTPNPEGARQCARCKTPFEVPLPGAPNVRDRNVRPELEIESMRQPVTIEAEVFAGFWRRFAAIGLDGLILLPVGVAIVVLAPVRELTAQALVVAVNWLYYAWLESSPAQGTWGKSVFGIKVTGTDGQRINFWRASWRWFAKIFSIAPVLLGFVLAAFTSRKRALHDYLASTLVTRKQSSPLAIVSGQGTMPLTPGVWVAAIFLFIAPFVGGFGAGFVAPYFRHFASNTVVNQSFAEADRIMEGVEAYRRKTGKLPTSLEEAGVTASTTFIGGVMVRPRDQVITFIMDIPPVRGGMIDYKLTERGGKMVWVCTSKTVPKEQLSPKCR